MHETTIFDRHAEHAWLHFAIRLLMVLLMLFVFLVLAGDFLGSTCGQKLAVQRCATLHSHSIYESLGS